MPNVATTDLAKYAPLVDTRVRKLFRNYPQECRDEAGAEGLLALCQAAQKFNPERGSFRRFAGRAIYNHLINFRYACSFERVGIHLSDTNLRFLARLEKQSRKLGHWPSFDESGIESKYYTPLLHDKLREYYEGVITRSPQTLTPDLSAIIATDRRIGHTAGPVIEQWTPENNSDNLSGF